MKALQKSVCQLIETACPYGELAGRIALVALFLWAGIGKLGVGYDGAQGYMESQGVPGALLPLVIALEIGGAIAVIIGWQTRLFALAFVGFSVSAALLFHLDFNNQLQTILFMKNIAIAGGFLLLCRAGAGRFSIDQLLRRNNA